MKNRHTDTRWCLDCDRRTLHDVWIRPCSTEATRCHVCNRKE